MLVEVIGIKKGGVGGGGGDVYVSRCKKEESAN